MSGAAAQSRVGIGLDAHRFAPERPLVLGGVRLREENGLQGHSDADVLTHAVMDALLGAAGLGDIGSLFPDTDPAFAGADSVDLLAAVGRLLRGRGWEVVNVDAVVVCEEPRVALYREAMSERLAAALEVGSERVAVKGTTTEGMGFPGRGEGIVAQAVALVKRAGATDGAGALYEAPVDFAAGRAGAPERAPGTEYKAPTGPVISGRDERGRLL